MKRRINCIQCNKPFWAKVKKDKLRGEVYVDVLDQYCQSCKNMMRQMGMKRKARLSEIPDKFNREITLRELYQAEAQRRKKEDIDRNKLVKKK